MGRLIMHERRFIGVLLAAVLLAPCAGLAQTGDTKNLLPKYGPSPKTEVEKEGR
jgi:hypothetical protein